MNSMLYAPLILSIIFVSLQLINSDPYLPIKQRRSPASIENVDMKDRLLSRPMVLGDDINRNRARASLIKNELKEISAILKTCGEDCDELSEAKVLLEEELREVIYKTDDIAEKESIHLKNSLALSSYTEESCTGRAFRPDPFDPVKVVNLNFHFPVLSDKFSPSMFVEDHDGLGNTEYNVFSHMNSLIFNTNLNLKENFPQNSPDYLQQEVLPVKFMVRKNQHHLPRVHRNQNPYYLDYYHYSSNINGGFMDHLDYVKDGKVFPLSQDGINLVFQEQIGSPEWYPPKYALSGNGFKIPTNDGKGFLLEEFARFRIRNGNVIDKKLPLSSAPLVLMVNEWMGYAIHQRIWNDQQQQKTNNIDPKNFSLWERGKLIAESIGFVGGLDYIWINANSINENETVSCDDHSTVQSFPWCGPEAGNNIMDTNCLKNAWSPCQLEIIHRNYQTQLKNLLYLPNSVDHDYDHHIPGGLGEVIWDAPHDLIGDLYVGEGTTLNIKCNVSLGVNARIIPRERVIGIENVRIR